MYKRLHAIDRGLSPLPFLNAAEGGEKRSSSGEGAAGINDRGRSPGCTVLVKEGARGTPSDVPLEGPGSGAAGSGESGFGVKATPGGEKGDSCMEVGEDIYDDIARSVGKNDCRLAVGDDAKD